MRSLSKFISKNEPHSKILQHNITREKILDASTLQSILPRLITTPDAVPQDWDSAYLLLLSKELEHRGFLIPESFKENEIQYSNKVQPLKRPKRGFFNSTISRIEALPDDAKYVFFGVPSDLGSSKSGARAGPDLIRGRSQSLNFRSNTGKGLYSINDRSFFNHSSSLFDVGNIALERAGLDCWLEAIQSTVSQMPHTSVPIMVGGDHTFTFASFKAIRKNRKKPVSFIHFDSHLDLQIWGEINQNKPVLEAPVHSNFMSHIIQDYPDTKIYQIGIKNYQAFPDQDQSVFKDYLHKHSDIFTDLDFIDKNIFDFFKKIEPKSDVYVSIDIDCLSGAYSAATGHPAALGITPMQLISALKHIKNTFNIIGADLMEVANHSEPQKQSATVELATYALLSLLGANE